MDVKEASLHFCFGGNMGPRSRSTLEVGESLLYLEVSSSLTVYLGVQGLTS